jgi:replicative DNA helicase
MPNQTPVGRPRVEIHADTANEQIILSAMMTDRKILSDLANMLDRSVFIGKRHKVIFAILREMANRHLVFDIEAFEQVGRNKKYGERKYILDLIDAYPNPPKNLKFHLDKLRTDAAKIALRIGPLQTLVDLSEDPTATLDEISAASYQLSNTLTGKLSGGIKRGKALYEHYMADFRARREEGGIFVGTGFPWLDDYLVEGLARKKLSVWTARPGMGKTTFAVNVADRVASRGESVGHFAYETGEISALDGIVSLRTGISVDRLVKTPDELTRNEFRKVKLVVREITGNECLAFVVEKPDFTKLYNIIREGNFSLNIFDLWEKLIGKKDQAVIAEYLDKQQQLSKDTDSHSMMIHQTKRGVEKRPDKRPTLEDLKNSGAYEENVDLAVYFYRDAYYDKSLEEDIIEAGVLKQRRGKFLGVCYHEFDGAHGRIGRERRDYEGEDDYE